MLLGVMNKAQEQQRVAAASEFINTVKAKLKLCYGFTTFSLLLVCTTTLLFQQARPTAEIALSSYRRAVITSCAAATNFTEGLLAELRENGTTPCHRQRTNGTRVYGFHVDEVRADTWHVLWLVSTTQNGTARCAGGDYYETDLAGDRWRSRPAVRDHRNGSYSVRFMVPSAFAGSYNFSAWLMFDNYHGIEQSYGGWHSLWFNGQQTVSLRLRILPAPPTKNPISMDFLTELPKSARTTKSPISIGLLTDLPNCRRNHDFWLGEWEGRWTRSWYNSSCKASKEGRFQCIPSEHSSCNPDSPCIGHLDVLESNGWLYSTHCKFHLWSNKSQAWNCLHGRWLFFWGDSNFLDTIRNLLVFVLGYPVPVGATLSSWYLPRTFEEFFINPERPDQWIHITMAFNGHTQYFDERRNGLGLEVLRNESYCERIRKHFMGDTVPDVVLMNSGLHDGMRYKDVFDYASAVDRAVGFWEEIWNYLESRKKKLPMFIYRTTVATAGNHRACGLNPNRMEVFNKIMIQRLKTAPMPTQFLDAFDMTFPWHYDNNHSDGAHYGRPPLSTRGPWYGAPHQYFVDLMLCHIILNAICN